MSCHLFPYIMLQSHNVHQLDAPATSNRCHVMCNAPHFEQPPLPPFPHPHPPLAVALSSAFILCHAAMPPDTFDTFLNPKTLLSRTVACAERWPDAHTTAMVLAW